MKPRRTHTIALVLLLPASWHPLSPFRPSRCSYPPRSGSNASPCLGSLDSEGSISREAIGRNTLSVREGVSRKGCPPNRAPVHAIQTPPRDSPCRGSGVGCMPAWTGPLQRSKHGGLDWELPPQVAWGSVGSQLGHPSLRIRRTTGAAMASTKTAPAGWAVAEYMIQLPLPTAARLGEGVGWRNGTG